VPVTAGALVVVALAAGMAAGCTPAAPSGSAGVVPTTVAPTRGPVAARFDIGAGRAMYLECAGSGSPTVVLVSGQRSSAAEWHTSESESTPPAAPVFEDLARSSRVCAYDRPGTVVGDQISRSDPVSQPTDGARSAADLRALLAAAGEPGPFVLVGHSIGGMIVRLLATTYPDDVSGLVLVDAASEFLQQFETPAQWRIQRALMRVDASQIPDSVAEYPDIETWDIDATFAQLRAAPPLRSMPLVVLSADELLGPRFAELVASGAVPAGTPVDFGATFDTAQAKAQARLVELVPGAVHVTQTDSGHNIHLLQPQLVTAAVREVKAALADAP
jgi:pimeloyl-ACP methyl ester carboxylesterase